MIECYNKDISKVITNIKMEGKYIVPKDYERHFDMAFLTFKFQIVFCPKRKCRVFLNSPENSIYTQIGNFADVSFLGE